MDFTGGSGAGSPNPGRQFRHGDQWLPFPERERDVPCDGGATHNRTSLDPWARPRGTGLRSHCVSLNPASLPHQGRATLIGAPADLGDRKLCPILRDPAGQLLVMSRLDSSSGSGRVVGSGSS